MSTIPFRIAVVFGVAGHMDELNTSGSLSEPSDQPASASLPVQQEDLEPGQCAFCLRILLNGTTEHHLIPKTCHKNKWFKKRFTREQMQCTVSACRDCHRYIHDLVPKEKDLGRNFYTVPLLMAHPDFAKFVAWVSRQK
ncbi:MAG: hypothetical protein AB8B55_03960 [Mariniblastus sp.]